MESNKTKKHRVNYSQISNDLLNDKNISLKAKGLYAFMFSKPENFNFTIRSLSKMLVEGQRSIMSTLQELKDSGWIVYTKNSDGTGEYFLAENPNLQNSNLDDPNLQNPNLGFSNLLKQQRINNTDLDNKKDNNKKDEIDFDALMKYYNYAFGKQMKVVNDKCKRQFKRLLQLTYTKADIKKVIDNASNDKFHEENDFKHLTLEFLSRQEKFEKYFAMPHQKPRCEQIKNSGHINH